MEEFVGFWGLLIAGVVAIWILKLLYGIRARQDEMTQQHEKGLRQLSEQFHQLRGRADTLASRVDALINKPSKPESPSAPLPAQPLPIAEPGLVAPAIPTKPIASYPPVLPVSSRPTPATAPQPAPALAPAYKSTAPAPAPITYEPETSLADTVAGRILRATWNWLVVGEEYRRPGESVEAAVATNWLIRIGVLVLVVGIGFFLKYSIDKGLLGPQARVAMCFLGGAGLLVGGVRLFGRQYSLLGQGLAGAGLATLYFAVFAATNLFHLIPTLAGFALMAFVTFTAGFLAVRYQTVLLAVLGTLGGYLTPIMLSTGQHNDLGLFSYLLLLALGITGIAWRQRWPALTYLSFVCHNLIFFADVNWIPRGVDFATTMPFFAAYFVLFTTAVILPCLTRGQEVSSLEPTGLFLIAAVFFYGSYELVQNTFNTRAVAWVTLGMAAYYTGHVYFFLQRSRFNRAFLATFLGLAAGALTLTFPLLLTKAWLTMSWSILALVGIWTALKLQSSFLRGLALLLQLFVVIKLGVLDLASAYDVALPLSFENYWPVLLDRAMQFGVPTLTFWLSSRMLARMPPATEKSAPEHGGAWGIACLATMYVFLFLVLNLELYRMSELLWKPCQLTVLTLVWVGFGLHFLTRQERLGPALFSWLAGLAMLGITIKLFVDFGLWQPDIEHFVYEVHYKEAGGLMRLLDVGVVSAYLALAWQVWRSRDAARNWAMASGYTAIAILFLHLTFETATFCDQYVPGFRGGSVSVLWALFAFALLISGIKWLTRPLRYLGLGLFCVVVAKVFLVDLEHLASIYRIAAFVVLGVVLLLAAFVYLRQTQQASNITSGEERAS